MHKIIMPTIISVMLTGCMANQTQFDDMRYAQKKQAIAAAMEECRKAGISKSELQQCAANDIQLRERQINKDKLRVTQGIAAGILGAAAIATYAAY